MSHRQEMLALYANGIWHTNANWGLTDLSVHLSLHSCSLLLKPRWPDCQMHVFCFSISLVCVCVRAFVQVLLIECHCHLVTFQFSWVLTLFTCSCSRYYTLLYLPLAFWGPASQVFVFFELKQALAFVFVWYPCLTVSFFFLSFFLKKNCCVECNKNAQKHVVDLTNHASVKFYCAQKVVLTLCSQLCTFDITLQHFCGFSCVSSPFQTPQFYCSVPTTTTTTPAVFVISLSFWNIMRFDVIYNLKFNQWLQATCFLRKQSSHKP